MRTSIQNWIQETELKHDGNPDVESISTFTDDDNIIKTPTTTTDLGFPSSAPRTINTDAMGSSHNMPKQHQHHLGYTPVRPQPGKTYKIRLRNTVRLITGGGPRPGPFGRQRKAGRRVVLAVCGDFGLAGLSQPRLGHLHGTWCARRTFPCCSSDEIPPVLLVVLCSSRSPWRVYPADRAGKESLAVVGRQRRKDSGSIGERWCPMGFRRGVAHEDNK